MMQFKAWQLNVFGFLVAVTLACSSVAWGIPLAGGLGIRDGANTISDDDYEVLINAPGQIGADLTTIQVGDVLFGAIGINFINGTASGVFDQEITVLYALQVATATLIPAPFGASSCLDFSAPLAASCTAFTFTAPAVGINAVLATVGLGPYLDPFLAVLPAATVGLAFVDPAKNFTGPDIAGTTFPALAASADGGQALLKGVLGIGSTGIGGNAPANLLELADVGPFAGVYTPGAGAGAIGLDLSVLVQDFPGFVITSSLLGVSSIKEPGGTNTTLQNFGARTDTTLDFNAKLVPEPATFLLFGSALLLFGGIRWLRRQRAQL